MSIDFKKYPSIKVGDLVDELAKYPRNATIDFCGLRFNRIQPYGDHHVQLEFDQAVYPNDEGHVTVVNPGE